MTEDCIAASDDGDRNDGEFVIVACACGWSTGCASYFDAVATYTEHLQDNAVAALAILDNAERPAGQLLSTEYRLIHDPRGDS